MCTSENGADAVELAAVQAPSGLTGTSAPDTGSEDLRLDRTALATLLVQHFSK